MPGKKIPEDRRREQILDAACRVALRQRLAGLSSRAVAAEAGVSNGLVFFYFKNRRELLLALLNWLLAKTILRRATVKGGTPEPPASLLAAEIREALEQLPQEQKWIELFFDYWFMGARDRVVRQRIRAALKRYRDSYLPLTRAVVDANPDSYAGITGESLADLVASYIQGCSLRLITDPQHYHVGDYAGAVAALLNSHRNIKQPNRRLPLISAD